MEIVELKDIYVSDLSVFVKGADYQVWGDGHRHVNRGKWRQLCGLVYVLDCDVVYKAPGFEPITATKGDLILLPQDVPYKCTFSNSTPDVPYRGISLAFELKDREGTSFKPAKSVLKLTEFASPYVLENIKEIARIMHMPQITPMYVNALMGMVLTELSRALHQESLRENKFGVISKGIAYMEQDADQTLSVAEVAALCSVSTNYFNRLFKAYSGMAPKEYRYNKLILKAKEALRNSTVPVNEISDRFGFESPSYFCRIFKRKTGYTPSEYRKKHAK